MRSGAGAGGLPSHALRQMRSRPGIREATVRGAASARNTERPRGGALLALQHVPPAPWTLE